MTADAVRLLFDRLGETLDDLGPFDSAVEEADAHRHLLRLTSAALDLFVERADPSRPLPTVWMSPTRKFLGDSPDTIYTTVPVSSAHRYVLTVEPGNALYIGAVVYARDEPGGPVRIPSSVVDRSMAQVGGRFTIEIGTDVDPDDTTGLHLDDQAFWVVVREYFGDSTDQRGATITVERTDGMAPDGPPDPAMLTTGIEKAANWSRSQSRADAALDALMAYPEGSTAAPHSSARGPRRPGVALPPVARHHLPGVPVLAGR